MKLGKKTDKGVGEFAEESAESIEENLNEERILRWRWPSKALIP